MIRLKEIRTRMAEIIDQHPDGLDTETQAEFDDLEAEARELQTHQDQLERAKKAAVPSIPAVPFGPEYMQPKSDPFAVPGRLETPAQLHSRALTAIERWAADDGVKERATETITRNAGLEEHLLAFSSPAYIEAFRKHVRDPQTGYQTFTDEERQAWAQMLQTRAALELSGAVVPVPLDPTIILSNDGTINPLRELARVVTTGTSTWRGITSAGITASYDAESATVSDDTPSLSELSISVGTARAFVATSIEVAMDQPSFSTELVKMLGDARDRLEATTFVSGAGTNGPKGFVTSLDGTASELAPDTAETFTPAVDVYTTQEALPARWRPRAVWLGELSTLNQIAAATDTTSGAFLFPEIRQMPNPSLLRRPVYEVSDMDAYADINPAASEDNFILAFMDPSEYVIADRAGMSVEFVQHLIDVTYNRPTGQRGWFAYWRNGAELSTTNAARVLSIPTAA